MTTKLEQKIDSMITDLNDGRHQQAKDAITLLAKEISHWTLEQVMPKEMQIRSEKDITMWVGFGVPEIDCRFGYNQCREDMKLKAQELGIIN